MWHLCICRTMCSDLVYVILFPQLLIVVHFKEHCNTYGSLFAYLLGGFIRLAGGEKTIYLPALIHYPMYDEESGDQLFPFRTMAMLTSMVSLIVISKLSKLAASSSIIHDWVWPVFFAKAWTCSFWRCGISADQIETKQYSWTNFLQYWYRSWKKNIRIVLSRSHFFNTDQFKTF